MHFYNGINPYLHVQALTVKSISLKRLESKPALRFIFEAHRPLAALLGRDSPLLQVSEADSLLRSFFNN